MRLWRQHNKFGRKLCFNPRTRKGCDVIADHVGYTSIVSIHAPVKDATRDTNEFLRNIAVSIHAPVKDATAGNVAEWTSTMCFNPRTRKGCDWELVLQVMPRQCFNPRTRKGCDWKFRQMAWSNIVSIHAPVKDATFMQTWLRSGD